MRFLKRTICLVTAILLLCMLQPVSAEAASYKNTYQNTGNHRLDIIGAALTQVGYQEGANNANKYGAWYHLNNEPWCAIFVSWCARQAEIPTSILRNASVACPNAESSSTGTHFGIPHYDGLEYTPLPGDLFFTKNFSHVGLVAWVDGDYFYTVEGNSNTAGSSNGDRVVCNRRQISDYYFGVPNYDTTVEPPAAPTVTTDRTDYREGENNVGETVILSWEGGADDVSRKLTVYYKGDKLVEQDVGLETDTYTLENAMAGGYLAVVSAVKSDGSTVYGRCPIDVKDPYTLTMRYHTGGGVISEVEKYQVITEILYLRSKPTTSSTRLAMLTKDKVVSVTQKQVAWGDTWGKTEYMGSTGYIAIRSATVQQIGYYADETGMIHTHLEKEPAVTRWAYDRGGETGLMDVEEFDLGREHYTFVGWSETPDGSGRIFSQEDASLTAQQIRPDFRYEDITIDLYAIWEKNVAEMSVQSLPAKTDYYTGELLDTTGLTLAVTYTDGTAETVTEGFTTAGFSSLIPGEKTVTVTFHGLNATFAVNILNRLQYTVGDTDVTVDGYVGASGDLLLPAAIESKPITGISNGAFRDNTEITGILIPGTVTAIGDDAFAGCASLTNVYFTGTQEQWDAIAIGTGNEALLNAQVQVDYSILGDMNSDRIVNEDDAIYLLNHVLFAEIYPATVFTDMTRDGVINEDDAIYLLQHVLFPHIYPL